MNDSRALVSVTVLIGLLAGPALAVNIETVPVGNPGNAGDSRYGGYGSVAYTYNIGKYEVTAGQYAEFLNAVAKTDTYGLYNELMDYDSNPSWVGCNIKRSGSPGSYTYSVPPDWANRPVNYVSWGDAARFANWLHNGQPTGAQGPGTTETGAYTLNGAVTDVALAAVTRNAGWEWAIPTEDEWYKAAYHKNDGVTGNYWEYPTGSNTPPSNQLIDPDPGNNATFYENGPTIGGPYYRTEVGAHENSESPYGTFDQGGNVMEWNEPVLYNWQRLLRGGSYGHNGASFLHASERDSLPPTLEFANVGFRVVQVPEPASMALLALAGIGMLARRRGHGR